MTNSEIREVYLFMNSQSCSRHSSDTYCRTDIGTVGWVGATTAPVFRRMISEPRLCLLEAWIQKLERESRLRLQGNDLMVCMEQKHRVRSTLSSLEVCGIHISNLLSPNLLVLNLRQTWLLLSSQHIWEGGTSLVLSVSLLQTASPTQRFPWHSYRISQHCTSFWIFKKFYLYLFGCTGVLVMARGIF